MYKPAFTTAVQLAAALALFITLAAPARAADTYRAEIVVLERLADPILSEQMAGKVPDGKQADKRLWVVDESGNVNSDIRTTSNLTLNTAASRLENSGKYRVLMKTGWIQQFPPDYDGDALRVEIGEFLDQAGHRAIEGTIEVNRRRYLLVDVELNHWRDTGDATMPPMADTSTDDSTEGVSDIDSKSDERDDSAPTATDAGATPVSASVMSTSAGKELITWIRETRRMRSKEIHFLDSPSIGVLIYFRPLD